MTKKGRSAKGWLTTLGPGLLTGAADDDPSGIATYSQGGAQFGYAMCWTMFLTTPFMIAIQLVSARIGVVTGQGLAANLGKALPPLLLHAIVGLLLIANTLNLAADIAAMGEATRLVVGGPVLVYVTVFGIACLAAEVMIPYHAYARYLKTLTLVLFAYVATAFCVRIPWHQVLAATLLPHLTLDRDFLLMLVAIFGTTISPYMFFWQASLEAEERALRSKNGNGVGSYIVKRLSPQSRRIAIDTSVGMVLSNVIGFFIIVTTAATLYVHGITHIATAA
jgi:NRAMP (natural resistance-associated macrophage protein)-like metal ion transporter